MKAPCQTNFPPVYVELESSEAKATDRFSTAFRSAPNTSVRREPDLAIWGAMLSTPLTGRRWNILPLANIPSRNMLSRAKMDRRARVTIASCHPSVNRNPCVNRPRMFN